MKEHPSTPFTSVSASRQSSGVNGPLSRLTKRHKVSECPGACQGGGEIGTQPVAQKKTHTTTWQPPASSVSGASHRTASCSLGSELAVPRCGCSGEDRLPLAFVVSICFPSHLLLVSHLPMFVWCRRELGSSASVPADSLSV